MSSVSWYQDLIQDATNLVVLILLSYLLLEHHQMLPALLLTACPFLHTYLLEQAVAALMTIPTMAALTKEQLKKSLASSRLKNSFPHFTAFKR